MKSPDYYLGQAEHCEAIAASMTSHGNQRAMKEVAGMWRRLACQTTHLAFQTRQLVSQTKHREKPDMPAMPGE